MKCICHKCEYSENNSDILTNIKTHHKPQRSKNFSIISFSISDYIPQKEINDNSIKKDINIRIEKYNNDKDYLEIIEYPDLKVKQNKPPLNLKGGLNKKKFIKKEYLNEEINSLDEKLVEKEKITLRKLENFPSEIENGDINRKKSVNVFELRKEIIERNKNKGYLPNDYSLNNNSKEINMYTFKNNSISSNNYKNTTTSSDLFTNHKNSSVKIEHKGLEEQISIISSD